MTDREMLEAELDSWRESLVSKVGAWKFYRQGLQTTQTQENFKRDLQGLLDAERALSDAYDMYCRVEQELLSLGVVL